MDPKERFSNRVEHYAAYRPSYPKEAIDYLFSAAGMKPNDHIADIGAGTGLFSKLLLEKGCRVTAIEPNAKMLAAAEAEFAGHPSFRAVQAAAEKTGLADESVDFITCAQSFHWFDSRAARTEFRRILRPGGKAVLIWNSRLSKGTPFREGYEALLQTYGIDYMETKHTNLSEQSLSSFFLDQQMAVARFGNRQLFDFDGLAGRLLSSSYIPAPEHPNFEPMMAALRELFDRTQHNGLVSFDYITNVFWGEV